MILWRSPSAVPRTAPEGVADMSVLSKAEIQLAGHIIALGLPEPVREHRFHPTRRWRFDFAWTDRKLAVEVDGVLPGRGGRHQRMAGFQADTEKTNAAVLLGWKVLRFTPKAVNSGEAVAVIEQALAIEVKQCASAMSNARQQIQRNCVRCGEPFTGIQKKRFCSGKCRSADQYDKKRNKVKVGSEDDPNSLKNIQANRRREHGMVK